MDQLIAFHGIFGSCVLGPPQKDYFFAVPWRGSFGRILTMQLELPKEEGDRVWLRDLPKAEQRHFDKLKQVWQGPFEILKLEGGKSYLVDTPQGPRVYSIDRLKPYHPALGGAKVPLYYHADIVAPPDDDGWVVQEILGHERRPDPKRRGKKRLFWRVHWKGADQPSRSPLLSLSIV